jgi:hypothetical protein
MTILTPVSVSTFSQNQNLPTEAPDAMGGTYFCLSAQIISADAPSPEKRDQYGADFS